MSKRIINFSLFFSLALILGTSAQAAGLEGLSNSARNSFGTDLSGALKKMTAKDIFSTIEECRIVDAEFLIALDLKEAVETLKPCAKALSMRAGIPVSIVDELTPAGASGSALELRLGAGSKVASAFMRDLNYSLRLRKHILLGHPVKVVRGDWKPL
ncbi:MAG: hypothetical protein COB53_02740 [Elusimicrobia bacterium]|nr:MAG: hypothetical protein COB53_02740 [Elusimicrobiota bacterium]